MQWEKMYYVKAVEDGFIPGKTFIVIIGSEVTGKIQPCDYI